MPPEVCAYWYSIFEEGHNIIIPDLEETKNTDPLQYENLKQQGVHSIVIVPLYDKGKAIGFCGVDNPPHTFLAYAHDMLQITASFLINCLRRRKLLAKLMDLSYKDALTKLGNRFALTDYLERLNREQSIAIVYCDITGLKAVNDNAGHGAGDALIINCGRCLEEVYHDCGVFRIGGDELLVVCPNVTQSAAEDRVALLREAMKEYAVNMAVGMVWKEKAPANLYPAVQEAETLMYADKAEYYRLSGIERRRC